MSGNAVQIKKRPGTSNKRISTHILSLAKLHHNDSNLKVEGINLMQDLPLSKSNGNL